MCSAVFTKRSRKRHKSNDEFAIIAIGRVGRDFFVKRGMNVVLEITGLPDQPKFADVSDLTKSSVGMFADGTFDELHFITLIMSVRLARP